jgi:hypothetical protein
MNRAAATATAAAAVLVLAGCGGPKQQPVPAGPLATAADQRATHAVAATQPDMNCLARTFGVQPADAASIDKVTTVYAWVYCHSKHGDTASVVPAAIGPDDAVSTPSDADYSADIKRIFPADVRDRATDEPQSMRDLVASLPGGPPPS